MVEIYEKKKKGVKFAKKFRTRSLYKRTGPVTCTGPWFRRAIFFGEIIKNLFNAFVTVVPFYLRVNP